MDKVHVMITPKETSLVRRTASRVHNKYCPAGEASELSKDDFYHYGIIGLLEAKKNFEPSRGVPWLAFAAKRVMGAMIDQLRQQPAIRLPQAPYKNVKALKEARMELAENGQKVHAKALALKLGWSLEEVHRVSVMIPTLLPVDTESRDDEEESGLHGVVLPARGDNPEDAAMRNEIAELVNRCLEALPSPKDRLVIVSRVLEGLKLREVAETLGCSLENVRQWQKRVEKMMKACMEKHGWSMEG